MSRKGQQKKKGRAAPKKAAKQTRSAKQSGKSQRKMALDPASKYITWARGQHNMRPTLPVSSGPRTVHQQTVTYRAQLVPAAKSCGLILSKDSAHTNYFAGVGGTPTLYNINTYVALTAGVMSGVSGITAEGQYSAAAGDNGSGFSKFDGGTVSWRSSDALLSVGGSAFLIGGRDLTTVYNNAGTAAWMSEADMTSLNMSRQFDITQEWQSARIIPTAPDQFQFRDIPEVIGADGQDSGEYIPASLGEFADRGLCDGIVFKTAATASPIDILLELHYSNVRYSPGSSPPTITRGQPNTLVPAMPNAIATLQNAITKMSSGASNSSGGMPAFSKTWSDLSHGRFINAIEDVAEPALGLVGAGSLIRGIERGFGGLITNRIPQMLGPMLPRILPALL
jgi:hypothetical protein